jgi:hypothetical protein
MTPLERASRYIATLPAAISGSRGHDALFRVACATAASQADRSQTNCRVSLAASRCERMPLRPPNLILSTVKSCKPVLRPTL